MIKLSRRAAFAAVLSVLLLAASCQAGFLFDIWDELLTPFLDVSPSAAVLEPGQSVTLKATGGRGPYEFALLAGATGTLMDNGDGTALYTAPAAAADDTIRLTDARGEALDVAIQVSAAAIELLRIIPEAASLTYGQSLALGHSGGIAPYVFTLVAGTGTLTDNGDGTAGYTAPAADTDAVIRVEGAAGQAADALVTVRSAPAPLAIVPVSVTMEEGTVYTFTATGGSGSYSFSATSPGLVDHGDGTADFTAPAAPDIVTVTVDDSIDTADATVTVVAASGSVLTIVPSSINVSFGSTFQFTSDGGVPPYSYAMGTTYGGTVTSAGLYTAPTDRQGVETVIVTDSRGITDTATVKVKKK